MLFISLYNIVSYHLTCYFWWKIMCSVTPNKRLSESLLLLCAVVHVRLPSCRSLHSQSGLIFLVTSHFSRDLTLLWLYFVFTLWSDQSISEMLKAKFTLLKPKPNDLFMTNDLLIYGWYMISKEEKLRLCFPLWKFLTVQTVVTCTL